MYATDHAALKKQFLGAGVVEHLPNMSEAFMKIKYHIKLKV